MSQVTRMSAEEAESRLDTLTEFISSYEPTGAPTSRGPVTVEATYRGQPSLGYTPGKRYQGEIKGNLFMPNGDDHAKPCPYTLSGFLRYWTNIEVVSE